MALVAVVAALSTVADGPEWYVALVILSLPLSLLALWVGTYAGLAVGLALGHDPAHYPWPVALVWVAVWAGTAWLNASLAERIVQRGWSALAPRGSGEEE